MANLLPDVPTDLRTLLFRKVVEILRANADLRVVKCWQVGDGSQADTLPFSSGLLPWIRLRPYSTAMVQVAQNERRHNFGIHLELATPGTSWDDFMNLWGAIEDALVKGATYKNTTVFDALRCLKDGRGATDLFIEQDTIRDVRDSGMQVIGRYGNGLIMVPFLKRS